MPLKSNQKGFAIVETLLIVLIITALVGIGWYVWHTSKQTNATLDAASKSAQSSPSKVTTKTSNSNQKYFTIKEWGVKAPYNGSTSYTYNIDKDNSHNAWINSQQLASADYTHCSINSSGGNAGYIGRYLPSEDIPSEGPPAETVQEFVSQDFKASNSKEPAFSKVGNYYYIYWQGQAACTDNETIVNQTNADIESIVKSLQAVR